MRKLLIPLFMLLMAPAFAAPLKPIENTPPPIDLEIMNRVWQYVKAQTGAPDDVVNPRILLDWEVPIIARMGTQYPTPEFPDNALQISVAPRTIDMLPPEMIQFGLGHEEVHYLFILKENDWDAGRRTFIVKRRHHCDPEFKAITRGIADLLWSVWHSDKLRAQMYDEVVKSCSNEPQQ